MVVGIRLIRKTTENTNDAAIYPFFYDLAEQVAPQYCLISQLCFLFKCW